MLYLGLCVALYLGQRSMIYFPSHTDSPARGVPPFLPFSAGDDFLGYAAERAPPRRVVVFFHGNAGEALHRTWLAQLLPDPAVALVLAEHPGFGARAGELSEESLVAGGHRVLAAVAARWRGLPVTVLGESLGTGVACAVARDPGVDRLGLISPFSSTLDVAQRQFFFLPVALLMKDQFRSDRRLAGATVRLGIVHGALDDIVPLASGRQLFDGYTGPKEFTELAGAHHNDMAEALLRAPEAKAFAAFLAPP